MTKNSYRPDIDGLRAFAILFVLLYHAKFNFYEKSLFNGGYVGVDVFFVISGYLISKIIMLEIARTNSFSFKSFYDRRLRRIIPMLYLTIVISSAFAWIILGPLDLVEYSQSIIGSIFFVSNVFFYFNTTSYGAESSLLKPLLHTWSLSVEEQFYIIFPLFCLFFSRSRHFLKLLIGISLASLAIASYLSMQNSELNFYFPLSRFWELAAGAIIAIGTINHSDSIISDKLANILAKIGLFLVVSALFLFDSNTPHPTLITAIPVIGTCLVIIYSPRSPFIYKVLSNNAFVNLGLISYSAYLIHFPMFAYARIHFIEIDNSMKLILILSTIALSTFTYKFVEKPFRDKSAISGKHFTYLFIFSSIFIVVLSLITIKKSGFTERFGLEEKFVKEMKYFRNQYWSDYSNFYNKKPGEIIQFPDDSNVKNILVIGNSWAHDIAASLSKIEGVRVQYEGMTGYKCNEFILPLPDEHEKDFEKWQNDCSKNARKFSELPNNTDIVILADNIFQLDQYSNASVKTAFESNLAEIRRGFVGKILIIKGRPTWKKNGYSLSLSVPKVNSDANLIIQESLVEKPNKLKVIDDYYREFYSKYNVSYLSLIDSFCDEEMCSLFGDNEVYYFDGGHLTKDGARKITPDLIESINN